MLRNQTAEHQVRDVDTAVEGGRDLEATQQKPCSTADVENGPRLPHVRLDERAHRVALVVVAGRAGPRVVARGHLVPWALIRLAPTVDQLCGRAPVWPVDRLPRRPPVDVTVEGEPATSPAAESLLVAVLVNHLHRVDELCVTRPHLAQRVRVGGCSSSCGRSGTRPRQAAEQRGTSAGDPRDFGGGTPRLAEPPLPSRARRNSSSCLLGPDESPAIVGHSNRIVVDVLQRPCDTTATLWSHLSLHKTQCDSDRAVSCLAEERASPVHPNPHARPTGRHLVRPPKECPVRTPPRRHQRDGNHPDPELDTATPHRPEPPPPTSILNLPGFHAG